MNDKEILLKAEADEGMTIEEIKRYQELVNPQKHVYGKYGSLAKKYLEEHNTAKLWGIVNLPEYLHGIDRQAEDMQEVLTAKFSKSEQYKRTGDFMEDYHRLTAMNKAIEDEILSEIVYVE
ncbi:MAG: TnpV protein [Clostridiales bacterium]|nr:TnpV protein [Clostridiales bacterium]